MVRAPLFLPMLALLAAPGLLHADIPSSDFRPDPASVQRYGPAYRFPQAGWIVLHIEGDPYERGYQHGRLLSSEIAAHLRCMAALLNAKAPTDGWQSTRRLVNALFLRRFDKEYLEEMKGIADGATAAGGKFAQRPIDLVDIVALNCWPEIETLDSALEATPTGLEGLRFPHAQPRAMPKPRPDHCSAFAATGPATADGKIVFGHITMFGLYSSYFYNVWLDVKPAKGHRVFMCAYPGAMQSGMDYYMNDAGLLIAETTISQTRFDIRGLSEASRIRQAIQYAATIDQAVAILQKENNGLYTNEWLLADINSNEIALYELGTHKSKLHRSSKNEWIGGTTGFYWGCNNTKDLELRLETVPSVEGRPANVIFRPSDRDLAWQRLYHKHKGKIGVAFGKEAFTTPPLAAFPSLDAKFTTTDLARQLKSWALFGPPLGRTWHPTDEQRKLYPEIKPLVSNPWTILHGNQPDASNPKDAVAVDLSGSKSDDAADTATKKKLLNVPAWHGTLLPQSDADIWLSAAFADYERIYSAEKAMRDDKGQLSSASRDKVNVDLYAYRSSYLAAALVGGDVPLSKIKSDITSNLWYRIASGKGVLLLHHLRHLVGDTRFEETMDSFGRAMAGKKVTTEQFCSHVEKATGLKLESFFGYWLNQVGLSAPKDNAGDKGGVFSIQSYEPELENTLIVYGSADETPTNREAAESLQKAVREKWSNVTLPIKSDKEVTSADVRENHLLLIGRPDSNALVERYRTALPITFGSRSFVVRGKTYAHPGSAVVAAAENPANPRYSMVVVAGLSAESTLHAPPAFVKRGQSAPEVLVLPNGRSALALVVSAPESKELPDVIGDKTRIQGPRIRISVNNDPYVDTVLRDGEEITADRLGSYLARIPFTDTKAVRIKCNEGDPNQAHLKAKFELTLAAPRGIESSRLVEVTFNELRLKRSLSDPGIWVLTADGIQLIESAIPKKSETP